MFGTPCKHVWTYAGGLSDDGNYTDYYYPCADTPGPDPPSLIFVGKRYYCESGNAGGYDQNTYYYNDVLWDGKQCVGSKKCI